jgi:hypothetical protein
MRKIYCDLCGKEYLIGFRFNIDEKYLVPEIFKKTCPSDDGSVYQRELDCCEECSKKIAIYIESITKKERS